MDTTPPGLRYNAAWLARTWLAVALASGKDAERPALDRTVLVEFHDYGVRLVATDSTILLHGFVGAIGHEAYSAPGLDELPSARVVACDPHGRGKGLMGHLLKLASEEDAPIIDVGLSIGNLTLAAGHALPLEGLEKRSVVFDHADHEQVALGLHEGSYPDWRPLMAGHEPATTTEIALNPEILGKLGKLGKLYEGLPLVWTFGGADKMARLRIGTHADAPLEGAAMPLRWSGEPANDDTLRTGAGVL